MITAAVLPEALRQAWLGMGWKSMRGSWEENRTPVLPELRSIVDRFVSTRRRGSHEFASESQRVRGFDEPYWGFKCVRPDAIQSVCEGLAGGRSRGGNQPRCFAGPLVDCARFTGFGRTPLARPGGRDHRGRCAVRRVRQAGPSKPAVGRVPFCRQLLLGGAGSGGVAGRVSGWPGRLSAHGLYTAAAADPARGLHELQGDDT